MKSLDELKAIREKTEAAVALRREDPSRILITVGLANDNDRAVVNALSDAVDAKKLDAAIVLSGSIANGGNVVEVSIPGKDKVTYIDMTAEKAVEVIERHVIGGNVITEYTNK